VLEQKKKVTGRCLKYFKPKNNCEIDFILHQVLKISSSTVRLDKDMSQISDISVMYFFLWVS
jgi:hypothetical protein